MRKTKILKTYFILFLFFFYSFIRSEWNTHIINSSLNTSSIYHYLSLILDLNKNAYVVYFDNNNNDLIFASFNGSSWENKTLDSSGKIGTYPTIAIDSNNNFCISYGDWDNCDLKYLSGDGQNWNVSIIDNGNCVNNDFSNYINIAVDDNNFIHISYYDSIQNILKYAKFNGTNWTTEIVDSSSYCGQYSSIAIDSNNNPHIAYYDADNLDLKYARWTGSSWNKETVDSTGNVGQFASIALDSNNYPHITYRRANSSGDQLKYAKRNGTYWEINIIDGTGDDMGLYGFGSSIGLDENNKPYISYINDSNYNFERELMLAKLKDLTFEKICIANNLNNNSKQTSLVLGKYNKSRKYIFDSINIAYIEANYVKYVKGIPEPTSIATYTYTPTPTLTSTITFTKTPSFQFTQTPSNDILVDNMDDGDNTNLLGGLWFTFNDICDNGTSYVWPEPITYCSNDDNMNNSNFIMSVPGYNGTGFAARMTGYTTTVFPYGYIGMGTILKQRNEVYNLLYFTGVKFWCKGDNKIYKFKVHSPAVFPLKDADNMYCRTFFAPSNWTQVEILFTNLTQEPYWGNSVSWDLALSNAESIIFSSYYYPDPSIDLWIDNIEIFGVLPTVTPTPTPITMDKPVLYPNPAKTDGKIIIQLPNKNKQINKVKIIIYSINADKVMEVVETDITDNKIKFYMDSKLSPGIYYYRTILQYNDKTEEQIKLNKFVIIN
mgnify:CR=1 FL=1